MDSLLAPATYRFKGTGVQTPADLLLSYNWPFVDGSSASGQVVNHAYTAPGNYNVCLVIKTSSGCETRICKRHIVPGVNVPQLILTPNPVVNNLHAVFTSQRAENVTIKIYNANGLLVRSYTKSASAGINNWDFDAATLTTGIYSAIVQSTLQFATAIFFKQWVFIKKKAAQMSGFFLCFTGFLIAIKLFRWHFKNPVLLKIDKLFIGLCISAGPLIKKCKVIYRAKQPLVVSFKHTGA